MNGGVWGCVKEVTSFHVDFMPKDGQRCIVQILPQILVLEKILESSLESMEIKSVNPKGNEC